MPYYIYTRQSRITCAQSGQNLIINTVIFKNGYQTFKIENSQYSDYYFIKNVITGNYLEIMEGSKRDGKRLILKEKNTINYENQLFKLIPALDGFYTIQNKLTLKYLNLFNGQFTSGNYINQWTYSNSQFQEFFFQEVPKFELNTVYKFFSVGTTLCFDVEGAGTNEGTKVLLYLTGDGMNQRFMIEVSPILDYYYIKIMSSLMYLSIDTASTADNIQLVQSAKNKTSYNHQIFQFKSDSLDSYYYIIAKHSGKALTAPSISQSAYIKQYQFKNGINGDKSQKFEIKLP